MKMARSTEAEIDAMVSMCQELDDLLPKWGPSGSDGEIADAIRTHWDGGVSSGWLRVLFGMHTLLANCTDPDASTLEFNPEIAAALEAWRTWGVRGARR